jgi:hypothetical protein
VQTVNIYSKIRETCARVVLVVCTELQSGECPAILFVQGDLSKGLQVIDWIMQPRAYIYHYNIDA